MANEGTITQAESDGDVRVCATLVSPSGGIATAVTVRFTWIGTSTGRNASIINQSVLVTISCLFHRIRHKNFSLWLTSRLSDLPYNCSDRQSSVPSLSSGRVHSHFVGT